jgi:hypothetical protein
LSGHTRAALTSQVSFKNFVGSLGAAGGPNRDGPVAWTVSDRVATPPDLAGLYAEALLLLPASFYAAGEYTSRFTPRMACA